MKIALVAHEYPPFHGGGIGTYTRVMSDALAERGHEVHVLTNRFRFGSRDPDHAKAVHRSGNLWVHRIDALSDDWGLAAPRRREGDEDWELYYRWSQYLYYSERVADALLEIVREHHIDVAEFPECAAEGFATLRRRRLGLAFEDLPITITLHSPIREIYRYNLYSPYNLGFQRRATMEEYCVRHADAVSSPTQLLATMVSERLGLRDGEPPCEVIPLPIDLPTLPSRPAPRHRPADPTLLYVGRLEPRKGVKLLVDAAVRVMRSHPTLRVSLVGKDCDAGEAAGSMTVLLRRRIPDELQKRFEFVGLIPREALFARYSEAAACVFAAPWDNFPLACAEAMACGACVVASDATGMAEMIEDEVSGLLFRSGDADSLASAIRRVIENEDLADGIREAAARRIRRLCDPDLAVERRIRHYEAAIARRKALRTRAVTVHGPRPKTVAVLVIGRGDSGLVKRTLESVEASAREAALDVDPAVVCFAAEPGRSEDHAHEQALDVAARRHWLERILARRPDLVLTIWPGEALHRDFLSATRDTLEREPTAAWAGSWSKPLPGTKGWAYAGFDFAVPLDLFGFFPPPFALMRYEAFDRVGGWNLELPGGWRDWDLLLAFAQADREGVVLPRWLGDHQPRPDSTLGGSLGTRNAEVLMDAIIARNSELFRRHGLDLWRYWMAASPALLSGSNGSPAWHHWWRVARQSLARRYPVAARSYKRVARWAFS